MTELDLRAAKQRIFYPRNMMLSRPSGQNVVEFLIVAKDELGALTKTLEILSRHKLNILALHSNHISADSFIVNFFADFTDTDTMIDSLDKEIKSMKFVTDVKYVRMSKSIYDHFLFPITHFDGRYRVIVLRADSLVQIELKMQQTMGSATASILFQEGKAYAQETTAQQMSMFPGVNPDVLLENNLDGLRATGWGIFQDYRKIGEEDYEISVKGLPFHSPNGNFVQSHFFNGILVGMLEKLHNQRYRVAYGRYDEKEGKFTLGIARE